MRATARFVTRTLRAVKLVVTDSRIPWPLRWLVVVGALPIPGPVDEGILLIAAVPLFVFYRPIMQDAWQRAEAKRFASHFANPS
jgi:hypothetical protein